MSTAVCRLFTRSLYKCYQGCCVVSPTHGLLGEMSSGAAGQEECFVFGELT